MSIDEILMKNFSLKFNFQQFFFQSLIGLGPNNYSHIHVQVVTYHPDFFVRLFANHPVYVAVYLENQRISILTRCQN